jgi:hypothetical protein
MKRFAATMASLVLMASSAWAQQPDGAGRRLSP